MIASALLAQVYFALLVSNLFLLSAGSFYQLAFIIQLIGYVFVVIGYLLRQRKIKFKFLFLPYYFMVMNFALVWGLVRYFRGKQSVNWEKAQRMQMHSSNNT